MRVADFVRRDDPWSGRTVRVPRLSKRHRGRLALPVAHAHVVDDHIACDHLVGALTRHMPAAPPDHKTEFALVIERLRGPRPMNRIIGPVYASDLLVKENREGWTFAPGLSDMVGVVEADREELGRPPNRRLELHLAQRDPAL